MLLLLPSYFWIMKFISKSFGIILFSPDILYFYATIIIPLTYLREWGRKYLLQSYLKGQIPCFLQSRRLVRIMALNLCMTDSHESHIFHFVVTVVYLHTRTVPLCMWSAPVITSQGGPGSLQAVISRKELGELLLKKESLSSLKTSSTSFNWCSWCPILWNIYLVSGGQMSWLHLLSTLCAPPAS